MTTMRSQGLPEIEAIDLSRMQQFGGAFPHAWFERLRRDAPVWYHPPVPSVPELEGEGFWIVSRYDDIREVSRSWERFSSEKAGVFIRDDTNGQAGVNMMMTDPPLQVQMRNLVNQAFSPRACQRIEASVRSHARQLVEEVARQGQCEFVYDIAAEVPMKVISDILGVPEEDRHRLRDLIVAIAKGDQSPEAVQANNLELFLLAQPLCEAKRSRPDDDILSVLTQSEISDASGTRRLTDTELVFFFMQLAFAGTDTTWNAEVGGLIALIEHPDELKALRADPSLFPTAVEEILRWTSPLAHFRRTATRDTELRGQKIREGERVTVWYPSANHDEDVFDDPFRFDLRRDPNPHLSFGGGGVHFCLGSNLARMELRVVFEEVLRGVTRIELDGPVVRHDTPWDMVVFAGYKSVPLRFESTN